ncbi:TonB system transport protein ExbD [Sphingomonas sp. GM_Shp_2]|uniref:TonB system transport protein ExbD n=1 Tax=Sphingomonas sp. GM_Shp_2 TaxID=2937380 RepID=UPI00226A7276|nr:TonB system transport protein ExbD [Sphingomonas sp. GM_Shp_2]
MAINLQTNDGNDLPLAADINVTPFIDVILVLLIVFMVAAPLATVSVPIDLPTSNASNRDMPDKPVFVSVTSKLAVTIAETPVSLEALPDALGAATNGDKATRIFIRADTAVAYGQLMEIMDVMRKAGYLKIGLVAFPTRGG